MRLNYYHMPYNRAVPYLVGIMVGYILFKLRGKELKIHWVRCCWGVCSKQKSCKLYIT